MADLIQIRRDTAANWASVNPILESGEIGLEIDTDLFKIGDGVTAWASRTYGGLQGEAGIQGPEGPAGADGADSTIAGPQGIQGTTGIQGIQGETGATGPAGAGGSGGGSGATLTNYNFTATAGQTNFSGSDDNSATLSYTATSLIVTLNGVTLEDGTDYTATDGNVVVLSVAASLNDELNVVAFGGGGGGAVTVSAIDQAGTVSNVIADVTTLRFDTDSGFDVTDLGDNAIKIGMNSTFKTITVEGQTNLVAVGLDTLKLNAGSGITLTTNPDSDPQELTINSDGGGGGTIASFLINS